MKSISESLKEFLLTEYDTLELKHDSLEILRREFVSKFPPNQLHNMLIDDYVVGNGEESFCYCLETKLRELGSIKGGSTADKKFGVYFNKAEGIYRTIPKWDADLNAENAFINIKQALKELLIAGENDDNEAILKNPISPMFKNKILTAYYPDKYLSIFSEEHVDFFLIKLGIKFQSHLDVEEKRNLLIEYKKSNDKFKGFNNYLFMFFLYHWNNPKIKEIRLLPMSSKYEFPNMNYKEIQDSFFLNALIHEKDGQYNFRNSGINTTSGTLILFQIENAIIASAKLIKIIKHNKPIDGIYSGAYVFDTNSIRIFEPITAEEIRRIDQKFNNFTQVKQKLDSNKYEEIMALIDSKSNQVLIPEDIPSEEAGKYTEGSKKQIVVNAYERNPKARQACIEIYGTSCIICGFDFGEVYGEDFAGKIHVHHIKPLAEVNDEYEVDPENDLVPVCPNCHMILHSKKDIYTIDDVKSFINNRMEG
ncbi:MAG: HNH endonuclease [Clostridia bacterium]